MCVYLLLGNGGNKNLFCLGPSRRLWKISWMDTEGLGCKTGAGLWGMEVWRCRSLCLNSPMLVSISSEWFAGSKQMRERAISISLARSLAYILETLMLVNSGRTPSGSKHGS